MKKITFSIFLFATIISVAQDKKAYQIFDKKGKKSSYEKVLKAAEKSDVVLFGEYHDNSVVHWLQLEFTKDLAQKKDLVLGAEMLEADNQKQLDQYLNGEINQKQLDSSARLWKNYKTDYKPLVDFAKDKKINFIATNVPRRYASLVFKKDLVALDSLSALEKSWIAPLPIEFDPNPKKINFPYLIKAPKGYSAIYVQPINELSDKLLFPRGLWPPKSSRTGLVPYPQTAIPDREIETLFLP